MAFEFIKSPFQLIKSGILLFNGAVSLNKKKTHERIPNQQQPTT